jgi:hypothetical protein
LCEIDRCGNTRDELLSPNCKKVKVFEEMDLRKEQFWQMKELQNKHSEKKNDVSGSDKNYRNVKDFAFCL